jgi:hypothetical protein
MSAASRGSRPRPARIDGGRRPPAAPPNGDAREPHHRVYVVRLKHPRHPRRECFYVGMTGLTPEERFENHKRGHKAAGVVTRYGVELAPEWYDDIPPMPYEEAALTEPALADELRDRGFVVFGPTNRKSARPNG